MAPPARFIYGKGIWDGFGERKVTFSYNGACLLTWGSLQKGTLNMHAIAKALVVSSIAPFNRRSKYLWALLCLVVALPILYFLSLKPGVEQDDALIYLRYVRNVRAGEGLVFNQGERVNGLTSPLFAYLLLLCSPFFEDLHRLPIWVSGGCLIASVWLLMELIPRRIGKAFALLSGIFLASSTYFYCMLGMETALFVLMLSACLWAFQRHKHGALGVFCALLLLTRPEGVFLVLAMAVEFLRQKRPLPRPGQFVLPGAILAAHLVFSTHYYGSPLSQSASAKIQHGLSGFWGKWPTAFLSWGDQLEWYFGGKRWLWLAELFLAVLGALSLRFQGIHAVIAVFLVLYSSFYVLFNIANHPWYYAPYYFFGFFYVGVGTELMFRGLRRLFTRCLGADRARTSSFFSGAVIAALVCCLLYPNARHTSKVARHTQTHTAYRSLGCWLKERTLPDTKLAAVEIGTLGWYSERPIIDVLGLVSPPNARFIAQRDVWSWLSHDRPDYMVSHEPPWEIELGMRDAVKAGEFEEEKNWEYPGYNLYVRTGLSSRLVENGALGVDQDLDPARLPLLGETRSIKLDRLLCGGKPFTAQGGNIADTSEDAHTRLAVVGYAIDPGTGNPARGVFICFDDRIHVQTEHGKPREDVVQALHNDQCLHCGFQASVDLAFLEKGRHEVSFKAVASDGSGVYLRRLHTPLVVR